MLCSRCFVCVIVAFCLCSVVPLAGAATTVQVVSVPAYDLVYDPFSQRIYASVSAADPRYGNTIITIDPVTAVIEKAVFVGSDPKKLAISGDGQYIYAGLDGSGTIARYFVPSGIVDQEISMGTGDWGTIYAEDITVQPGHPKVIAVSRYNKWTTADEGVAIYDDGIKRPRKSGVVGMNRIEFSDSPEIIYGFNNESTGFQIGTVVVSDNGAEMIRWVSELIRGWGVDIEYENGFLYSTSGGAVNTQTMLLAGQFPVKGPVEPETIIQRVFFVSGSTLYSCNSQTFAIENQYTVSGVSGNPKNLIRWGKNGLAYNTDSRIVLLQTDLVPDPPTITGLVIQGPGHLAAYKGQYQLIATFSDGVVVDVTSQARWSSQPADVARIDETGTVIVSGAETAGSATLTAQLMWAETKYEANKNIAYDPTLSVPGNLVRLEIIGPRRIVHNSKVSYVARAFFDDGSQFDVSSRSLWQLSNHEFAGIDSEGHLTVNTIARSRDLVIYAAFGHKGMEIKANATVTVMEDSSQVGVIDWPTYQANPRHTGYVPWILDSDTFSQRWEKSVQGLKPVSVADGKVFVATANNLQCLDASDGKQLWTQYTICQHQPTYAYGNVYVQDRSSQACLRAFDAESGKSIFTSSYNQQVFTWSTPVVYDGYVYMGGGYFGGFYAHDAFSGAKIWWAGLTLNSGSTLAADGEYVYGYTSVRGFLTAFDRRYGNEAFTIIDPSRSDVEVPVIGDQSDILVIPGGRLKSFDLSGRALRWEIAGGFSGIPSVARGVVYAINNGVLQAHDEATGQLLWTWTAPAWQLTGPMIVTYSHVLISTNVATYAVEIAGRRLDWSYPSGGYLSFGNDSLYIADPQRNLLTAITVPGHVAEIPVELQIVGPEQVFENTNTPYQAIVTYEDGRMCNRTMNAHWTFDGTAPAAFDSGALSVGELLYPRGQIDLDAEYTQDGVTVKDRLSVTVKITGTVEQLMTRNLESAVQSKQTLLLELQKALVRERATLDLLRAWDYIVPDDSTQAAVAQAAKYRAAQAVLREDLARLSVNVSMKDLNDLLSMLTKESPYLDAMDQYPDLFKTDFDSDQQRADINGDGQINLLDLEILSRYWLKPF